jgi:Uma2 family endonuclease
MTRDRARLGHRVHGFERGAILAARRRSCWCPPDDRPRDVLDKVGEYLQAAVCVVWVIDPEQRSATIYRSLAEIRVLGPEDDLDGEDVVPGFRCRLANVID